MTPKILLVNPPIYDFAAYDFWVKPYGLLSVAGYLRARVEFALFDYLNRLHPFMSNQQHLQSGQWGRGRFYCEQIPRLPVLVDIPRYFRRFGLPRNIFRDFLMQQQPFDFVFIQTMMTYWYPGVREVIEDVRRAQPAAKIVLGGNYVTLCGAHARRLGADFLVEGANLDPLWEYLALAPDLTQPALWQVYEKLDTGVLKLSDGCPFSCTYCSVPNVYRKFKPRPLGRSVAELHLLSKCGVQNIAFYDDALLFDADEV
ncbi:MAG: radical SAM protein, partial [Planctomycetota bacterium]